MPGLAQQFRELSHVTAAPADGATVRAWTGGAASARIVARRLGDQFLVAAVAAAAVGLANRDAVSHPGALLGIAATALCVGIYLRFATYVGAASVDRSITGAILLLSATAAIATPLGLLPVLYLWPLLLTAHYALPGRVTANVALAILGFSAAVLAADRLASPAPTLLLAAAMMVGTTVAYRRTRAQSAELFLRVEEMVSRDPLTGALTGEAFGRAMHAWIGHGMRRQVQTSLLVVQVDDLAGLRSAHGSEVADAALRHLAQVVFGAIRETDAFGRLGDDEFGLLFPATKAADAVIAAERIRSTIARRAKESGVTFTVSIGIASEHVHEDPWAAARTALSHAIEGGGNQVISARAPRHGEFDQLADAA